MEAPIKTDPDVLEPVYTQFPYLRDYPLELRGSFIEDAVSLGALHAESFLGFVMAYSVEEETPTRDRYPFLSEKENMSLNAYRHVRPVQAWPQPVVGVMVNARGEGLVMETRHVDVVLKIIGNAQLWYGGEVGVLWEGYLAKGVRSNSLMYSLWVVLERYLTEQGVKRVFTYAQDPEFTRDWYRDFLTSRGYRRVLERGGLEASRGAVVKVL